LGPKNPGFTVFWTAGRPFAHEAGRGQRLTVCESERPGVDTEQARSARARCAVRFRGARLSVRGHRRPASPGRSKWHCHPSCIAIPLRAAGMARCRQGRTRGRHAARSMRLRRIVRRGRHAGSGHSAHPGPAGGAQLPAHGKWGSDGLQDGERAGFCDGKLDGCRRLRTQTSSQRFAYVLPPPATV